MSEITVGVLNIERCEKVGEPLPRVELKKAVPQGMIMAEALMKKVVLGERVNGRRLWFGEELIRELNRKFMFYYPGVAGEYRIDDETLIGGLQPAKAREVPMLMYKFGTWIGDEVDQYLINLHKPILEDALRIAAAAHYGLVRIIHPFNEGNKRTARVLSNGILMLGTDELIIHRIAIPPIPLVRAYMPEEQVRRDIEVGKKVRMDPYFKSLLECERMGTLCPLELFFANIWLKNILERIRVIDYKLGKNVKNPADKALIDTFKKRQATLEKFIEDCTKGKNNSNQIPDFFALRHIKK